MTWPHVSAMAGIRVAAVAPRADHDDLLARQLKIVRPALRMHDAALEGLHPRPFRGVAFRMPVIALAHPQEIRREGQRFAAVGLDRLDGPQICPARPARRGDLVAVADMRLKPVFGDHLAHIAANFGGGRDRRRGPGLEAIAEGVQVAVGADAGIAVGQPGAAKAFLGFEHDKTCTGQLRGQVIGAADAGDAGADDQDIEMLGRLGGGSRAGRCKDVHEPGSFFDWQPVRFKGQSWEVQDERYRECILGAPTSVPLRPHSGAPQRRAVCKIQSR